MSRRARSVSALLTGLALLVPAMTGRLHADDEIDKKVVEIVKRTGDLYKNARSLHAEGDFVSTVASGGEKRDIKVKAVYDVERPNHLSLKTQVDGDPAKGPDIIADGKNLTIFGKSRKQYTQEIAPEKLEEIGLIVLQVGPTLTGMLFANILAENPSDMLMLGVNSCSYVGKDKVGDASVHRLKFSQDGFDWEMWVAAEGKPYVLRMIRITDGPEGKVTTTETYKNWKLDGEIAKDTYTFSPPKDSQKVDEFDRT
jgi:hypothetical protein